MKKFLIPISVVIVLIVLVAGGLAAWAYYEFLYTEPLTPVELAELEIDWTPVTGGNWSPWVTAADGTQEWNPAKSFNTWLATVPEEDKAWPIMVDVKYAEPVFYDHADLGKMPVQQPQWDRLVEVLDSEESREMSERIGQAFRRPVLGCGMYNMVGPIEHASMVKYGADQLSDWDPSNQEEVSMMLALLPSFIVHRECIQFLTAYAMHAVELGNLERFHNSLDSVNGSTSLFEEAPFIISMLMKISVNAMVVSAIDWAIDRHAGKFTDEQLHALDQLIKDENDYQIYWRGEMLMFEDAIRRLSSPDGSLTLLARRSRVQIAGTESFGPSADLPRARLHPSSQRVLHTYDQIIRRDFRELNDLQYPSGYSYLQSRLPSLGRYAGSLLETLPSVCEKSVGQIRKYHRYNNAVRLAIAVRRYELRHGELPGSIEELDPDLVAGLDLMDPFSEEMLTYQRTENGFEILPSHPEDEPGEILWPKQYEQIVERDEPEYLDGELEGLTEEQKQEMLDSP